jgi:hypothetical protein
MRSDYCWPERERDVGRWVLFSEHRPLLQYTCGCLHLTVYLTSVNIQRELSAAVGRGNGSAITTTTTTSLILGYYATHCNAAITARTLQQKLRGGKKAAAAEKKIQNKK